VPGVTPVWLSFLAFAIDLPIALLSWTVIEKPALSLRAVLARRSKKHRPPVALPAA
jgi:peptidoglycan/LPS O-acetylase OafA/YrhL